MINLLALEWFNRKDLEPIKLTCYRNGIRILDFEDVHEVNYSYGQRFLRYWSQLKRFKTSKIPSYLSFIRDSFINKQYVFHYDNVRKLNIMSLDFEAFQQIIDKHAVKGIII